MLRQNPCRFRSHTVYECCSSIVAAAFLLFVPARSPHHHDMLTKYTIAVGWKQESLFNKGLKHECDCACTYFLSLKQSQWHWAHTTLFSRVMQARGG